MEAIITIVILGVVAAVALPIVAVLAKLFMHKYDKGWKLYYVVAFLQLLFLFTWGYSVLDSFPSSAAPVFLGALAIILLACVVLGVLLYPILFFLAYRPQNWRRNMAPWVIISVVIPGLIWLPGLYNSSGISTNVDLHGRILDLDGKPVSGARLNIASCDYLEKNPVITNSDGRFHLVGNCRHLLIVKSIVNRSGAECLTRLPGHNKSKGYRLVYESHSGMGSHRHEWGWDRPTAENPDEFTCVFERPRRLFHYRLRSFEMVPDGRVYTAAWKQKKSGDWTLEIQEGEHDEGLMRFQLRFERSNHKWVGPGTLTLSNPESGLQFAADESYLDVAPLEGYESSLVIDKLGIDERVYKSLYFSTQHLYYGAISIDISTASKFSTTDPVLTPRMSARIWINDDRNRAVLSHLAEDK